MVMHKRWRKKSSLFLILGVFFALLLATLSLRTALRLSPQQEQRRRQRDDSLAWITDQLSWQSHQKSRVLLPSWPDNRSQRFPSIAQRVQFYLGPSWNHLLLQDGDHDHCNQTTNIEKQESWTYDYQENGSVVVLSPFHLQVTSKHNDNGHPKNTTASTEPTVPPATYTISNEATLGIRQATFVHLPKIKVCADSPQKPTRYCKDVLQTVMPAATVTNHHTDKYNDAPPILMRFGDALQRHTPYPLFQKFRPAFPKKNNLRCGNSNDAASSFRWPMIW